MSMVANHGDRDGERRTVRNIEPVETDLSLENITMDGGDDHLLMGEGRANPSGNRDRARARGNRRATRYLDD